MKTGTADPFDRDAAIQTSLNRKLTIGYGVIAILVVGLIGYAAIARIRGAVIAPGNMVVEGNIRRVQHQDGGSIAEIRARNGQKVQGGDLLVRLDDTQPRAELGVVLVQLYGQLVRAARLNAEQKELPDAAFPSPFAVAGFEVEAKNMIEVERGLFQARRRARDGEIAQLHERIDQIQQEIEGLNAQLNAVQAQAAVTRDELVGLEELLKKGLTQLSRINPQRLSLAQLEGQVGDIKAQIARARGRISEIGIQIAQVSRQMLNEVSRDLREASEKIADLQERRLAAEAKLRRIEVRAPVSGIVHQLAVFTIGGVLTPGETVLQIVPEDEKLLVESRVDPLFIDQLSIGQEALVRFSSFDQRQTPELQGRVVFISADLEQDQRQQSPPYFRARVELNEGEAQKIDQRITSGLPAELHLRTQERTILSYFLKPLTDQIARTFRER